MFRLSTVSEALYIESLYFRIPCLIARAKEALSQLGGHQLEPHLTWGKHLLLQILLMIFLRFLEVILQDILFSFPYNTNWLDYFLPLAAGSSAGEFQDVEGETEERRRARLERHQRTQERAVCVICCMKAIILPFRVGPYAQFHLLLLSACNFCSGKSSGWEEWTWPSSPKGSSWETCK